MNDEVLSDQLALMCRQYYVPLAATVPGAVLVAVAMGPSVSEAGRVIWVCALAIITAARFWLHAEFLRIMPGAEAARRWLWLVTGLAGIAGLIWSCGGTVLLPVADPHREVLVADCLMAVVASSYMTLSAVPGAFAAFAISLLVPTAAWHLYWDSWPRALVACLYFVFLAVMLLGASRAARTSRRQFQLIKENRRLSDRLREERDAAVTVNQQLQVASEAKSRFLGHVSHELRTPLTVILGYTELMLRDVRERERRPESLERIKTAGKALLDIVNDLLDIVSIEAGRFKMRESEFSLPELLNDIVAALRRHGEAGELDISYSISSDLPMRIRADRGRIQQVLLNLGVNALHFTQQGRVNLHCRLVPATAEDGDARAEGLRMRVEVADTGSGIPIVDQERIFEPFVQLESDATPRSRGVGLGLSITRAIVEQMGGSIGVESLAGIGSRFWFEIPIHGPTVAAAAVALPMQMEPGNLTATVLVAEDVAATRGLLVRFLRERGCEIIAEVATGTALVGAARNARYDLMLVDWRLPELDGLEAIRIIRADERAQHRGRTPILVVTASAMPGDRRRCLEAGADEVVDKPIDFDGLDSCLRRWLAVARRAELAAKQIPVLSTVRSKQALVADDHFENLKLVCHLLEDNGWAKVDGVANGREAVAAWQRGDYELLVLDWKMPELGGLEALRQIRALEQQTGRRRTAVVIVTGRAGTVDRQTCLAAGADECVPKPYLPEELIAALERALRRGVSYSACLS